MRLNKYLYPPRLSLRFWPYWRRNFLVWKKLIIPSIFGNLADPMLYMFGLGFGLGGLLPNMEGMPYIVFLAGGTVCYGIMNTATFEVIYSGFSRMHAQKTWEAVLNAPLHLDDVVLGEIIWAACKSFLSALAILLVIWVFGLSSSLLILWIVPLSLIIGFCFASMGMIMTAISPNYDFFLYYFTLFITPMTLLCGVFFSVTQLPPIAQTISSFLPLTHAVNLIRPLLTGHIPTDIGLHIFILFIYGTISFYIALVLLRRRLLI